MCSFLTIPEIYNLKRTSKFFLNACNFFNKANLQASFSSLRDTRLLPILVPSLPASSPFDVDEVEEAVVYTEMWTNTGRVVSTAYLLDTGTLWHTLQYTANQVVPLKAFVDAQVRTLAGIRGHRVFYTDQQKTLWAHMPSAEKKVKYALNVEDALVLSTRGDVVTVEHEDQWFFVVRCAGRPNESKRTLLPGPSRILSFWRQYVLLGLPNGNKVALLDTVHLKLRVVPYLTLSTLKCVAVTGFLTLFAEHLSGRAEMLQLSHSQKTTQILSRWEVSPESSRRILRQSKFQVRYFRQSLAGLVQHQ